MPSGACRNVGSREGYWRETAGHWDEWTLHPSRTCNDTILPFVRVRTGCEADEGNQQELGASALRCVDMDTSALRRLRNASVLMIGDSVTAGLYRSACLAMGRAKTGNRMLSAPTFSKQIKDWIGHNMTAGRLAAKPYYHLSHGDGTHHWCAAGYKATRRFPYDGPALGSFVHYGVVGPPWYSSAYPLAPFIRNTTFEQVVFDLPKFCRDKKRGVGCTEPDLVIAHSALWDLAAFAEIDFLDRDQLDSLHTGLYADLSRLKKSTRANLSRPFQIGGTHISRYVRGVERLVRTLQATFPSSRILWRTMHPSDSWKQQWVRAAHRPLSVLSPTLKPNDRIASPQRGSNPVAIHALNVAIKAHAKEWNIEILDVGSMLQQLVPRRRTLIKTSRGEVSIVGTYDGMHLIGWLNLAVFNLVLNELWRTVGQRVAS